MNQATLLVIRGPDQGTRFTVGESAVMIGRGVRSDVRILDTEVSRQHAVLGFTDGAFAIQDRGSSNGTFVNGEEVRNHRLRDGDQIQLGATVVLFNQEGAEADESSFAVQSIELLDPAVFDDRSHIVGEMTHRGGDDTGAAATTHTLENLVALYRISEEILSPALPLDQLLRRTLDLCIQTVRADRGCLLLADPATGKLEPQVYRAREAKPDERMSISTSIVNYVLERGQGVRTSDAAADSRFEAGQSILNSRIREALCVPMQGRFELIGIVYVDVTMPNAPLSQAPTTRFDDDHLRLLLAIARQAALAAENDRYQTAVLKAERLAAVGQTIAMLSHHIKNILQGVRGGSYLIDRGLERQQMDLVRRGWDIVERNQDRIYHLVMDMLTYGKDRKPALQSASLSDVVADVCELAGSRAEEFGVTLETHYDTSIDPTTIDPEGIHRAALNIVMNAIDAAQDRPDARVVVRTEADRNTDEIRVVVEDNGTGIPPEQLQSIFQVFESSKGSGGTGLGLAVSRKIVREHGGDVRAESEVGVGSRFVLAWPRIEEERSGRVTETEVPRIPMDETMQPDDFDASG